MEISDIYKQTKYDNKFNNKQAVTPHTIFEGQYNSFNPLHPTVQHMRKIVQRPEVRPSITSSAHTNSLILCWVTGTLLSPWRYYNGFKRSKDEWTRYCSIRKHVTFTIHQKLTQIMRLKSDESQRKVMPSYSIALSTIYNIKNGRTNYNCLWHQVKVWTTFPSTTQWKRLNYHNWTKCHVTGLWQCVLQGNPGLSIW